MNLEAIKHNVEMLSQAVEMAKDDLAEGNSYRFENCAFAMRRLVRTIGEEAIEWADRIEQENRIVREKTDGIRR